MVLLPSWEYGEMTKQTQYQMALVILFEETLKTACALMSFPLEVRN